KIQKGPRRLQRDYGRSARGSPGRSLRRVPSQTRPRRMGLRKERKTLPRRPHRRKISRHPTGRRLSRLPRPHRKADSLATARRGEERWHPTHRELRHVARQQRQRPLFCAPGIKVFRRWQTRPRSTPGLPPPQRHHPAGGREMAGTVLELRPDESCCRKPAGRLRVRSVPLTTRLALRRFDVQCRKFFCGLVPAPPRVTTTHEPTHPWPLPGGELGKRAPTLAPLLRRGWGWVHGLDACAKAKGGPPQNLHRLLQTSRSAFDAGAGTSLSCGKIYELPAKARLFYRIRHDSRCECC